MVAPEAMRVVVVGTGTEVGKTFVGCQLLKALMRRTPCVGLKPVESGWDGGPQSDAALLAAAASHPAVEPAYCFERPVSPHLAAREAGVEIDLEKVQGWVEAHPGPLQLVETAGGLLSPLGPGLSNKDMLEALAPDAVLLVGADRLGALHDVAAALSALGNKGRTAVALSTPAESDASTGTNAAELQALGIAPFVVTFPRGEAESEGAAEALADWLLG